MRFPADGEELTIGTVGQTENVAAMPVESFQLFVCLRIPDSDASVGACRCQLDAIGMGGQRQHWPQMLVHLVQFLAGFHVPEANELILARRCQHGTVLQELNVVNCLDVGVDAPQ